MQKVRPFIRSHSWTRRIGTATIITGAAYGVYHCKSEAMRAGMSGLIGTLIVELACYPVDTINMMMKAIPSKNPLEYVKSIIRKEGFVTTLYRGVEYVYHGYPICLFFYYLLYKSTKDKLKQRFNHMSEAVSCTIAAFVSEFLFIVLVYPLELYKTRAQVPAISVAKENSHVLATTGKKVIKCYVGFVPNLITYTSFVGLQFGFYNWIVNRFRKKSNSNSLVPPTWVIAFASITSGALASVLTNPLETWTVMVQTGKNIRLVLFLRREIFFRGLLPRVTYNMALTTALFFSLEHVSALFNVQFSH